MTFEQPIPGIYRISVPTPYPVGPVNCYLLDGPAPVLVDCGPATQAAEAALRRGLVEIGLAPSQITQIVLTHHHADHSGGLSWLGRETAAPLYGHPANDAWLRPTSAMVAEKRAFLADLSRYCGLDSAQTADLAQRYSGYERALTPRGIDQPLLEGESVALAGAEWRVLETPGHAGTHISLLRADGTALVGDTVLERISSNALIEPPLPGHHGRIPSLLVYRETLRRLANERLDLVLPGHGSTFRQPAALIARRLRGQEDRAQRLLALLQPERETVSALTAGLFPNLPADQLFLGLSEVLGHLDILETRGQIRHLGAEPARYQAID